MLTGNVKIKNSLGLHARPAMTLVDCASRYQSEIVLLHEGQRVDAKSIMELMMLAAGEGTELGLEVSGNDADVAFQAVVELFDQGFGEN